MSLFYRIFQHLLPTGKAFRLTPKKTLGKFFLGLAGFAKDARAFVDQIWLDIFPVSTRQLPAWEHQHGLYAQGTEEDRIATLRAEWQAQGGQSLQYLQGLMRAAGFEVTLHEHWARGRSPYDLGGAYYSKRNLLGGSAFSEMRSFDFGDRGRSIFCLVRYQGAWLLVRLDLPRPYRLENIAFWRQAISLDGLDTSPEAVKLRPDGFGFFLLGGSTRRVYELSLSVPWDLNTTQFAGGSLDVSAQEGSPTCMAPSWDGRHLYVAGSIEATLFQYDLSTPWQLGIAGYGGKSYAPSGSQIFGVETDRDGDALFVLEDGPTLRQYALGDPDDVSTAEPGPALDVSAEAADMVDVVFGGNGGQVPGYDNGTVLLCGSASANFYQYSVADYEVRNPHDYLRAPNLGRITCGGVTNTCQGDYPGVPNVDVVCSTDTTSDSDYLVNKDLTNRAPPPIPQDPNTWPYFFYVGGEEFGQAVSVAAARKNEFERLLLKFRPAQLWIGLFVHYESGFVLTDSGDFVLTGEDDFIITN